MFPNVKAEMARQDMTLSTMAEITGIPLQRLSAKLKGKRTLTFDEAISIKDTLGVDMSLEELFERRKDIA